MVVGGAVPAFSRRTPRGRPARHLQGRQRNSHPRRAKPVLFELESQDVNHSFWVPSLHGKKDLIPGEHANLAAGGHARHVRGQCAEYCGEQHANMVLWIVAQTQDDFKQWVEQQRQAAPTRSSTG